MLFRAPDLCRPAVEQLVSVALVPDVGDAFSVSLFLSESDAAVGHVSSGERQSRKQMIVPAHPLSAGASASHIRAQSGIMPFASFQEQKRQ